jgi:type VI secretion system secreted protein Hcp
MKTRLATLLGVLFLGVSPLLAAVDAFIKFDGVSGESHQPGRTGWIEIDSWSFGASQAGTHSYGSGGGEGKVSVHDISITKKMDKASPLLANAALTGKHFQTVTLDVKNLHYVFEDVVIKSVQHQGLMGDGRARELIKMSYVRDAIHDPPVDRSLNGNAAVSTRLVTPIQPNATFGGGVSGGVMLQSLRLVGQTEAIIVVCDVAGGQTLAALQRASQSRQPTPMPTLSVRANPKQPGQPYLQFTFTNVLVSGYSMATGGCSQVTLHFSKFDGPPSGY